MIRITIILLFLFGLLSCEKESDKGNELTFPEDTNFEHVVSNNGGYTTINFTAKTDWTATITDGSVKSDSWCSVSPPRGEAGYITLAITTEKNSTTNDRNAAVVIVSGGATQTVELTQTAGETTGPDEENGETTDPDDGDGETTDPDDGGGNKSR